MERHYREKQAPVRSMQKELRGSCEQVNHFVVNKHLIVKMVAADKELFPTTLMAPARNGQDVT